MKYYTQHPKYFKEYEDIEAIVWSSKAGIDIDLVEISEEEARKIILTNLEIAKKIDGHNIMGVSESFYDPYYLVRQMIKEQHINVDELLTETLFWMIETANFASECFY